MQDAIATGLLGNAVVYDETLIPLNAFAVGHVVPDGSSVAEVLDKLAETVPGLAWGVNADQKVFFGLVSGTASVDARARGTTLTPRPNAAEELTSAVLWLVAPTTEVGRVKSQQTLPPSVRPPYLTHLSSGNGSLGWSAQRLMVDPKLEAFEPIPAVGELQYRFDGGSYAATFSQGNFEVLLHRTTFPDRFSRVKPKTSALPTAVITMTIPAGNRCDGFFIRTRHSLKSQWAATNAGEGVSADGDYAPLEGYVIGPVSTGLEATDRELSVAWVEREPFDLFQLYPVRARRALLNDMAAGLFKYPAARTASVTQRRLVEPAPTVSLTLPDGAIVSEPAARFTLSLTKKDYGLTTVEIGEVDDQELARAALIRARGHRELLTAVMAPPRRLL